MSKTRARTRREINSVLSAPLLSDSILAEEVKLETGAIDEGVRRYRKLARAAVERGDGASLKPAERLLAHWFLPLEHKIECEQDECRRGIPGIGRQIHGPVIVNMRAAKLAAITMHEVVSALMREPAGVPLTRTAYAIGRAIFAEYNLAALKDADSESRRKRRERGAKGRDRRDDEHEPYRELTFRFRNLSVGRVNWWAARTLDDQGTQRKAAVAAGCALIHELIESASSDSYEILFQPAFTTELRHIEGGKEQTFLVMAEKCYEIIADGHDVRERMRPRYLPMLVPPYKWSTDAQGGYVQIRTPYTSKPTVSQKAALAKANLATMNECLDAVCETGWQINRPLLDVVRRIVDSGGGMADVPLVDDRPKPPHPEGYDPSKPPRERWVNVDPGAKERYKAEAAEVIRENVPLRAARFEFMQKLAVAERFEDREAIYYPHQLDFRGRCYPIPAHLNHQGDDLCRGLLQFAEGKAPGEAGERWVFVQAANVYGHDKISYADRIAWVKKNLDGIVASVRNPLECDFWHPKYDSTGRQVGGPKKPWQFLAACNAIVNPEAAAHLPVDQDGTCNGLQHYAALALDPAGAAVVNMLPGEIPVSVYINVANAARPIVETDALRGVRAARLIQSHIDKDLVKQPTMTQVYGVTAIGARQQIEDQLVKIGIAEDDLFEVSRYLAGVVLKAIGTVCPAATRIMDWLRTCAGLIARAGHLVAWTTPLGFPVVQPYRRWKSVQIGTILGRLVVETRDEDVEVATREQIDGSAPNFVHSIDKCHMFMTARECRRRGVTRAFVHDAYRTHAATRDLMGRITREQFVELHTPNRLLELVREWRKKYPEIDLPDPPKRGKYDLRNVLESLYFFN